MTEVIQNETRVATEHEFDRDAYLIDLFHSLRMEVLIVGARHPSGPDGRNTMDAGGIAAIAGQIAALFSAATPEKFLKITEDVMNESFHESLKVLREQEAKTPGFINNHIFAGLESANGKPFEVENVLIKSN